MHYLSPITEERVRKIQFQEGLLKQAFFIQIFAKFQNFCTNFFQISSKFLRLVARISKIHEFWRIEDRWLRISFTEIADFQDLGIPGPKQPCQGSSIYAKIRTFSLAGSVPKLARTGVPGSSDAGTVPGRTASLAWNNLLSNWFPKSNSAQHSHEKCN